MSRSAKWMIIVFLAIFASFGFNAFHLAPAEPYRTFQMDSQALTLGKIAAIAADPARPSAWLAPQCRPAGETAAEQALRGHTEFPAAPCEHRYTGNPAIHAIPMGAIAGTLIELGLSGEQVILCLRLLVAALTAAVATWLVLSTSRLFGAAAAAGVSIAFLGSTYLILMAPNLYWIPFTLMLPAAWTAHFLATGRSVRSGCFLLGLSALLVVRFLSGFEFITNVILSAAVIWIAAPQTRRQRNADTARDALAVGATILLAVVLAVALHVAINIAAVGDAQSAWDDFVRRVLYRTADIGQGVPEAMRASLQADRLNVAMLYLMRPTALAGLPLILFLALVLAILTIDRLRGRPALPAVGLALIAIGASMSWHLFAKGHSAIHTHINHVLAALPALPVLFGIAAHRIAGTITWR